MSSHSRIGASSSSRWMACPASVRMSVGIKNKSTPAAREGTAAHALAEFCLKNEIYPECKIGKKIYVEGQAFDVGYEMVKSVSLYIGHILYVVHNKKLWTDNTGGLVQIDTEHADFEKFNEGDSKCISVEEMFSLTWIKEGMFGTCDCNYKDYANRTLYVFDLKYGKRSPVSAEDNSQMKYYALGIIGEPLNNNNFDEVVMVIVQPRNDYFGVSAHKVSVDDLYLWAESTLRPAAEKTDDPCAPFASGDHCRWCPAFGVCPQIEKDLGYLVNYNNYVEDNKKNIELPDPRHLTPEEKSRILHLSVVYAPWIDAVAKSAYEDAISGRLIPGFKLVKKRKSRRVWRDDEVTAQELSLKYGDTVFEERKLKSPSKLEVILTGEEIDLYSFRPESGLELKPENDKRKPVNPLTPIDDFYVQQKDD